MDPITTAIVAALSVGALKGVTATAKAAVSEAYEALKKVCIRQFGQKSNVIEAMHALEKHPTSEGRTQTLHEELTTAHATEDAEVITAAKVLLDVIQAYASTDLKTVGIDMEAVKASLITLEHVLAEGPHAIGVLLTEVEASEGIIIRDITARSGEALPSKKV